MRYILKAATILGVPFLLAAGVAAEAQEPGGMAGAWLVNANGYTFVMRLSGDGRFSGTLTGLNNSNEVTRIDGSRSGDTARFTRSNSKNDRIQQYQGRVIVTEEGRWMFGTFRWQGGDYNWCAVGASLVPAAERRAWSDCKVGWETAKTGIAQ